MNTLKLERPALLPGNLQMSMANISDKAIDYVAGFGLFGEVPRTKPRASDRPDQCYTTELHPWVKDSDYWLDL